MRIFGFEIKRPEDDQELPTFSAPINDDGAINVGAAIGGSYASVFNMEGVIKTESELVTKYRSMSLQPEIKLAVDAITNEAINVDTNEKVVNMILDDTDLGDKTKKRVYEEFENILRLLGFSNNGYEIFRNWYIDGRLNYHVIIDESDLKRGIVELRYIDPRRIRLVREIDEKPDSELSGVTTKRIKNEFYLYSDAGFGDVTTNGMNNVGGFYTNPYANTGVNNDMVRIAKDSIVRVTSGLVSEDNSLVLSYLHSSIKPLNLLRSLEDANVIYTLTRAPQRRVFYIDVGNLPTAKAEQYLYDMMQRHKNKLVYDPVTGKMNDDRRFLTMTEDFWFPRREGSRSTEIDVIEGSGSLTDNEQLEYFQKNLYKSLNIPLSRLESENQYTFGRVTEMSREEVQFSKFIRRLRSRFSTLFDKLLERQLVLKGIITPEEWSEIQDKIRYDFMRDNYFEELKSMEILREKVSLFESVQEMIGTHFSMSWAYRNILFMSDDQMKVMRAEIEEEKKLGYYDNGEQFDNTDDEYLQDLGLELDDKPTERNNPFAKKAIDDTKSDDQEGIEKEESKEEKTEKNSSKNSRTVKKSVRATKTIKKGGTSNEES